MSDLSEPGVPWVSWASEHSAVGWGEGWGGVRGGVRGGSLGGGSTNLQSLISNDDWSNTQEVETEE